MSIVTTYTCDKCGTVALTPDDMFEVTIGLKAARGGWNSPITKRTALWCRACVVKTGLEVPKAKETAPKTPATLEDIVRNIVEEAIDASA